MPLTPLLRKGQEYFSTHGVGKLPVVRAARDCFVRHFGLSWWAITERLQTRLVEQLVHPGDTAVDVGANIGYYTVKFSQLVGSSGRVVAFEPEPNNYRLLERNVARRDCRNVTLVQRAVAGQTGRGTLYLSPFNPGDHRIYDSGDRREGVPIETVRLDEYFDHHGGRLDFLKIDVQGAEGKVIESLERLWGSARTDRLAIMTEFWPFGLARGGTSPRAFLELLEGQGFTFSNIDEQKQTVTPITVADLLERYPLTDQQRYTNLLCTRKGRAATPAAAQRG